MKIDFKPHANVMVVTPHGPIIGDDAQEFRENVTASIQEREGRVVIDMEYAPYLDSVGIEALLALCNGPGLVRPRVANLGETCREALDLTLVLPEFEVFDTVENAIRSYKR